MVLGSLWLASYLQHRGSTFIPGACQRAEHFLSEHIVGQELALQQLVTAVCAHLESLQAGHYEPSAVPHTAVNLEPQRPLVLSVHGPPGVGKTYTHQLLARALYSLHPGSLMDCPGAGCKGYKVIYGLDFPAADRQAQLRATKQAILEHVASVRDPLLVFEEYDKLDCEARAWLRGLVAHAYDAGMHGSGAGLSRAIILLESNVGFPDLERLLTQASGDTSQLTPEAAERTLKDVLFTSWRGVDVQPAPAEPYAEHPSLARSADGAPPHATTPSSSGLASHSQEQQPAAEAGGVAAEAESGDEGGSGVWRQQQHEQQLQRLPLASGGRGSEAYADTVRFLSLVTFFLPYLPLQRHHITTLTEQALRQRGNWLAEHKRVVLAWDASVVEWLVGKVEFDGPYPLEGANQVFTVVTRYVAPALRKCPTLAPPRSHQAPARQGSGQADQQGEGKDEATTQVGLGLLVLRLWVDAANRLLAEYPFAQ